MGPRAWTIEELDNLKRWRDEGLTVGVIADRLGRTRNSIGGKLDRNRQNYPLNPRAPSARYTNTVRPFLRAKIDGATFVPPELLADRARRSDERAAMTPGQIAMGDPPSSQSATVRAQGASRNPRKTPSLWEAPIL